MAKSQVKGSKTAKKSLRPNAGTEARLSDLLTNVAGGFAVTLVRNETQRHSAALKSAGQSPIGLPPPNRRNNPNRQQPGPFFKRSAHHFLDITLPTPIGASLVRGNFEVAPHNALVNHVEPALRRINAHGFPVGK